MSEIIVPANQRVSRELILDQLKAPLNLAEIFKNPNPVELEIGIGKGMFLMHAAMTIKNRNFLGIEIRRKYLNKAVKRIEKRPIDNARLICGEAFAFMEEYLTPGSLSAIHVYFPDPWPKKRHHKRRLFSDEFMKLAQTRLTADGELLIATDHKDYWMWIQEVLERHDWLQKTDRLPEPVGEAEGLTNYEIKYKKEGRPIYRIGYRKT